MTDRMELMKHVVARGPRLTDAHLGLLLDDLQVGAGLTAHPVRLRRALALFARAGAQYAGSRS